MTMPEETVEDTVDGKKYVGTNIEASDYDRLKALADEQDRSVSGLMRVALKEYLSNAKAHA